MAISNYKISLFACGAFLLGILSSGIAQAEPFNSNFASCLQQNECMQCEQNPGHKNPYGYLGFYQMGVNYASEAICSNASSIPLMNRNQNWSVFESTCQLSPWAISQGITSHADWMYGGNPPNVERARQLQTAMLLRNSENTWNRIQSELGQYIGQTINGILMTKETMVAMAHLKGFGGLRQTLLGNTDVRDGNGTSTLSYAACMQGCLDNNGIKGECKFTVDSICS